MKSRPRWSLLAAGALIVLVLFTFPLWRVILVAPGPKGSFALANDAQREAFSKISKSNGAAVAATAYMAMLTAIPAPTAEQPTPSLPDAVPVRSGEFVSLDAVRQATGTVTLYRSADGSLLLRFDNFLVTNGPQMAVYLVGTAAPLTKDDLDLPGVSHFEVGPLKGSQGNQQFPVPKDLQFVRYQSVVIYSESLQLVYASAKLTVSP